MNQATNTPIEMAQTEIEHEEQGRLEFSPLTILSLPMDIQFMMLANLDILSLLRWRLVCALARHVVDTLIKSTKEHILGEYFPSPAAVLAALSRYHAVVSSEAALALFLRDYTILSQDLEICVRDEEFVNILRFFRTITTLWPINVDHDISDNSRPERDPYVYLIANPSHPRRRYLRLVRTYSSSVLVAAASVNSTVLMCIFNGDLMSCAYPALTLRRRGLIRGEHPYGGRWGSSPHDRRRHLTLVCKAGFIFSTYASDLINPPMARPEAPDGEPSTTARWCMGHFGLCACGPRHWADMYCLTMISHPTSSCFEYLVDPAPEELYPRMYTWSFPPEGYVCIGVHDFKDPNVEWVEGMISGVFVYAAVFNLEPTFVGDHMVGAHGTNVERTRLVQGLSLSQYLRGLGWEWWRRSEREWRAQQPVVIEEQVQ